jgi:hypothetical protein
VDTLIKIFFFPISETQIYVGRIFHEGEHLPAQIMANERTAVACYNDCSIKKINYEVTYYSIIEIKTEFF